MPFDTTSFSMGASSNNRIDPSVVTKAVNNWLAAHPEASTTVQDGAITNAKLDSALRGKMADVTDLKSAISNVEGQIATETGFVFSERREGEATSGSTAWVKTPIIQGISLVKGVTYLATASIASSLASETYIYVDDSQGNHLASLPISIGNTTSSKTFTPSADYTDVYCYFQTGITTGITVSATVDRNSYPDSYIDELRTSMLQHGYVFDFVNGGNSTITNYSVYSFEIGASETVYVKTAEPIQVGFNVLATFSDGSTDIIIPSGDLSWRGYYSYTPAKKVVALGYYLPSGSNNHLVICKEEKRNIDTELYSIPFSTSAFGTFAKFGVVGDSLSVGYMADSGGEAHGRNLYYSWGQALARRYGNTCLNFGFSGATTATWYSNATHGKVELVQSGNECQCYIIGLGVNDEITSENVGSASDIDLSDYTNNADTFYGRYGKIIQTIQEVNPTAYIFALTIPATGGTNRYSELKNNAIKGVVEKIASDNVYCIESNDYAGLFKSSYITNNSYSSHYTAIGYQNIASIIARMLTDCMNENYTYFKDIAFVPYGDNNVIE